MSIGAGCCMNGAKAGAAICCMGAIPATMVTTSAGEELSKMLGFIASPSDAARVAWVELGTSEAYRSMWTRAFQSLASCSRLALQGI